MRTDMLAVSCRGFVAQWLERSTCVWKTLGQIWAELSCIFFSSDPAVSCSFYVGEKGEKLSLQDPDKSVFRSTGLKSSKFSLVAACVDSGNLGHLVVS